MNNVAMEVKAFQANPSTVVQSPLLPERFFRVRQY
jgi:hypothetical protein